MGEVVADGRGNPACTVADRVGEGFPLPSSTVEPRMRLSQTGKLVSEWWSQIPQKLPNIITDEFQIMPNHLHGILLIGGKSPLGIDPSEDPDKWWSIPPEDRYYWKTKGRGDPAPTLGNVMGWFKYRSTKEVNQATGTPGIQFWQRSYYEHIIRTEDDLKRIRYYIEANPEKWDEDYYNRPQTSSYEEYLESKLGLPRVGIARAGRPRPYEPKRS